MVVEFESGALLLGSVRRYTGWPVVLALVQNHFASSVQNHFLTLICKTNRFDRVTHIAVSKKGSNVQIFFAFGKF